MRSNPEKTFGVTGISPPVPFYVINLKKRADRRQNVEKQFESRTEFSLKIIEAFEHSVGSLGLWTTIRHILHNHVPEDADYVIIGEDDIEFTSHYSKDVFFDAIATAKAKGADLLLGGISWLDYAVKISDNLYWAHIFNGTHLMVIYRDLIKVLLDARWKSDRATDHFIGEFTQNKFFIHPFVAVQKEFGYSDVTKQDGERNVDLLFQDLDKRIDVLNAVNTNYKQLLNTDTYDTDEAAFGHIQIPTYIINLPERTERLEHIKAQFIDRPEFATEIIEAVKHPIGALGLWLSIRKVINKAIQNDDDVIVICEDDHQFTEDYSRDYLLRNIIEANNDGACLLSGGTAKFENIVPITKNRYWVGHCLSTQFIVIFRKFYQQILDMPYDEDIVADLALSKATSNKMILYPFVSTQRDFGYSDITYLHNQFKNLVVRMFKDSDIKLKKIQTTCIKHKLVS